MNFGWYKVEEKLYLGVRKQNRLNNTVLYNQLTDGSQVVNLTHRPAALCTQEDSWYLFLLEAE
jgi:hypothetical protein